MQGERADGRKTGARVGRATYRTSLVNIRELDEEERPENGEEMEESKGWEVCSRPKHGSFCTALSGGRSWAIQPG